MSFEIYVSRRGADLPVRLETLREIAKRAFSYTTLPEGDISLLVCDDEKISSLNREYRGKPGPTDVLSFSMREGETSPGSSELGDIVISVPTTEKQAALYSNTLQEEFIFLFTHGLLHLLGFDHDSGETEAHMMRTAQKIISEVTDGV